MTTRTLARRSSAMASILTSPRGSSRPSYPLVERPRLDDMLPAVVASPTEMMSESWSPGAPSIPPLEAACPLGGKAHPPLRIPPPAPWPNGPSPEHCPPPCGQDPAVRRRVRGHVGDCSRPALPDSIHRTIVQATRRPQGPRGTMRFEETVFSRDAARPSIPTRPFDGKVQGVQLMSRPASQRRMELIDRVHEAERG